jgi:hypothetical protein
MNIFFVRANVGGVLVTYAFENPAKMERYLSIAKNNPNFSYVIEERRIPDEDILQ